eukprot:11096918-Prorocentrum_lima.AAC.1
MRSRQLRAARFAGAAWRFNFSLGYVYQFCLRCLDWLAAGIVPVGGAAGCGLTLSMAPWFWSSFAALEDRCRLDVAESGLLDVASMACLAGAVGEADPLHFMQPLATEGTGLTAASGSVAG